MKRYLSLRCMFTAIAFLGTIGVFCFYQWNLSFDVQTIRVNLGTMFLYSASSSRVNSSQIFNNENEVVVHQGAPSYQATSTEAEDHRLRRGQLYDPSRIGTKSATEKCNMDNCVTYSQCSLTRPFSFYLYPIFGLVDKNQPDAMTALHRSFSRNEHRVTDPLDACIYIVVIDICDSMATDLLEEEKLYHDGENHVFWTHCSNAEARPDIDNLTIPEHSMVASESFQSGVFRTNFDIVVSYWESAPGHFGDSWMSLPPVFPFRRKYLVGYAGCNEGHLLVDLKALENPNQLNYQIIRSDKCHNKKVRRRILRESIFSLILLPFDDLDVVSSASVQREIYESLQEGAIPVVVGARFSPPFQEVLDWSKVMITIPTGRLEQLLILLDAISDSEIVAFKKQGRLFLEKYLGSVENIVETFLGTLRTRFGLVPRPFPSVDFEHIHDDIQSDGRSFPNLPVKSIAYVQNYSVNYQKKYEAWNERFQPFKMYPNSPWEEDIRLQTSGRFFSDDFNGTEVRAPKRDRLRFFEQFTVVMLTYKRHEVLVNNLKRLNGLKYLHKVIIVWNELDPPPEDLQWPVISAPIVVIFPRKNSLNNKYLPFDEIETEAVLALDDEIQFDNEELVFGFQVWAENRDRLVGYMARYHSWDEGNKSWRYTWNDDCEISMTLTCATFFHKIYLYKYTYEMPEVIRRTVDEKMNCDDLAMNFLISHVSKKPPIKVTPKRDFSYPGAKGGISSGSSHLQKRDDCLNLFSEVYGYMPLRFTILRADSMFYNKNVQGKSKAVCFNKV